MTMCVMPYSVTKAATWSYTFADKLNLTHVREALPNTTFVGFTGTPLTVGDKVTRHVFSEYADVPAGRSRSTTNRGS